MRNGLQYLFMPTFLGQAVIVTPNDLGIKSQGTLFAAALQHNARLARQLMSGDRDHLQVRSTNLLSVPSELAANTFKDLPEVKPILHFFRARPAIRPGRRKCWPSRRCAGPGSRIVQYACSAT
jgi:hypothetical protein